MPPTVKHNSKLLMQWYCCKCNDSSKGLTAKDDHCGVKHVVRTDPPKEDYHLRCGECTTFAEVMERPRK
ncbi:hypothetical protein PGQ11_008857 [Apiospora arundinis]|uniref:Uncharacterized protein n=1 Tax=Apiospora arundinis TaxID=335852 RepID=A0ABR2IGC8_9PEZI